MVGVSLFFVALFFKFANVYEIYLSVSFYGTCRDFGGSSPIAVDKPALQEFCGMAVGTNPIFLLAARVIVMILNQSVRRLDAMGIDLQTADENACWATLQESWTPLKHAWKIVWWEGVAVPDDVDDEEAFLKDLQ